MWRCVSKATALFTIERLKPLLTSVSTQALVADDGVHRDVLAQLEAQIDQHRQHVADLKAENNNPFAEHDMIALGSDLELDPALLSAFAGSYLHAKLSCVFRDHKVPGKSFMFIDADREVLEDFCNLLTEPGAPEAKPENLPLIKDVLVSRMMSRAPAEVCSEIDRLLATRD